MLKRIYYIIKQRLYQYANMNKPCEGKIYMFHDISDINGLYSINKNDFSSFINWLFCNKKIVTIEELINNKNKDNVVLTFDDAFFSIYEYAYPILREKNIPYYVFICNDLLNKDDFINEGSIKEMLLDSKCIVGSHRMKHELSRTLSNEELMEELINSKKQLEGMFNISVNNFAFPYGSMYACSKANIDVAGKVFNNIFMTYNLPYNHEYRNIIPRININSNNYKEEMK